MKILSIILLLNICFINSLTSQTAKTTQELLTSTKWEPQDFFANGDYGYVKYTKTEFFTKMMRIGVSGFLLKPFNEKDFLNRFNVLIDKAGNGKYIIRDGGKYVFISEILELTATKLVLRNLTPGFTTTGKKTTYLKTDMDF